MTKDKKGLLQEVPLFRSCSPKELDYLTRLSDEVRVPAGRVLAEKGAPGHEFFLVLEGNAVVDLPDGPLRLGPGDFFGEMALLDNEPRSATVTSETDMDLFVLGSREFSSALAEVPAIARSILRTLAQRVRQLEQEPPS